MSRHYRLLLFLFAIAITSQGTFTIDVVRTLAGDYPVTPITLGSPWPSITALSSDAALAGLRHGDRVLDVEGRVPAGESVLARAVHLKHPGQSLAITVERGGAPVTLQVPIKPFLTWWSFALITLLFMPWLSIPLGFWVAAMRPRDPRAWLVLGILMGVSQLVRPTVIDPRGWPEIGPMAVAFRELAAAAWPLCMMLFGIYFPQRWRVDRMIPWAKWVFIVPVTAQAVYNAARDAVASEDFNGAHWPALVPNVVITTLTMTAVGIFFMALASKYHEPALAPDDRRRLKVLYWGSTIALAPSFLLILYSLLFLHRGIGDSDALAYSMMAMAFFPVTMAYVIVVGRALDVRMIVRTGMQYGLARGGIRVIQAILVMFTILLIVNLAEKGRVSKPAQITQIALAVLVVVRIRQAGERLSRWVDRRFFRESYNSEQILSELSEQVRSILNTHELLETVTRKISESLHVRHIAVMLLDGGVFRPAIAAGYALPADYELSATAPSLMQLQTSRAPIDTAGQKELAPLDAQLVLPLASNKELLGFISLGPRNRRSLTPPATPTSCAPSPRRPASLSKTAASPKPSPERSPNARLFIAKSRLRAKSSSASFRRAFLMSPPSSMPDTAVRPAESAVITTISWPSPADASVSPSETFPAREFRPPC